MSSTGRMENIQKRAMSLWRIFNGKVVAVQVCAFLCSLFVLSLVSVFSSLKPGLKILLGTGVDTLFWNTGGLFFVENIVFVFFVLFFLFHVVPVCVAIYRSRQGGVMEFDTFLLFALVEISLAWMVALDVVYSVVCVTHCVA
jgi:hypothetical protein